MFAVKSEVLDALFADPEWRRRWDEADNLQEFERILTDFCKAKGLKIAEVKT